MAGDLEERMSRVVASVPPAVQGFLKFLAEDAHLRARRAALELGMTEPEADVVARVTTMSAVKGFKRAIDSVVRERAFALGRIEPQS